MNVPHRAAVLLERVDHRAALRGDEIAQEPERYADLVHTLHRATVDKLLWGRRWLNQAFYRRLFATMPAPLEVVVAEREGQVLGYAYANYFRPRMAYRFALEDSIYLAPSAQGQGVGTLLLDELIRQCQALGARQMLAVIGDSANQGSIRLHAKAGFEATGVMRSVGWKFERWLDVVIMQRALGRGDALPPEPGQ